MIAAGLVEMWRKRCDIVLGVHSTCNDSGNISNLSVLWQIPQYVLVGASEVFASVSAMEFFSGQAPESMQVILYSLNLMAAGVGYLMATVLVGLVDVWSPEWIPNDLDRGYLEYYYF